MSRGKVVGRLCLWDHEQVTRGEGHTLVCCWRASGISGGELGSEIPCLWTPSETPKSHHIHSLCGNVIPGSPLFFPLILSFIFPSPSLSPIAFSGAAAHREPSKYSTLRFFLRIPLLSPVFSPVFPLIWLRNIHCGSSLGNSMSCGRHQESIKVHICYLFLRYFSLIVYHFISLSTY
jgi:hypothetical protein